MASRTIGRQPNAEDESATVTMLNQENWLDQARFDSTRLRDENLNDEPDAW